LKNQHPKPGDSGYIKNLKDPAVFVKELEKNWQLIELYKNQFI
jgi:hypothetical protein